MHETIKGHAVAPSSVRGSPFSALAMCAVTALFPLRNPRRLAASFRLPWLVLGISYGGKNGRQIIESLDKVGLHQYCSV